MGNERAAKTALNRAWDVRKGLVPGGVRKAEELSEEDFDELCAFWVRDKEGKERGQDEEAEDVRGVDNG
jgi:hypothetical protein